MKCATCKYWGLRETVDGPLESYHGSGRLCTRLANTGFEDPIYIDVDDPYGLKVVTRAEFGCTEWTKKEQE